MTQVIEPQQADFVPVKDQTYTLPWRYLSAAEHRVELRDQDELVARLLVRGVDYTISPQGDTPVGSGTLTLLATPTASEVKLVVAHDTVPDQNYRAVPGAEAIERQLDRYSHKFQQLDERLVGNLSLVDRARRWAIEKDGVLVDDEDFSSKAYAGRSKASSQTAINAAEATAVDLFVDTYAEAAAALAGLSEGDVVDVGADETRGDYRTRYRVESGGLVFKIRLEPYRVYDSEEMLRLSNEPSRYNGAQWHVAERTVTEMSNDAVSFDLQNLAGVKFRRSQYTLSEFLASTEKSRGKNAVWSVTEGYSFEELLPEATSYDVQNDSNPRLKFRVLPLPNGEIPLAAWGDLSINTTAKVNAAIARANHGTVHVADGIDVTTTLTATQLAAVKWSGRGIVRGASGARVSGEGVNIIPSTAPSGDDAPNVILGSLAAVDLPVTAYGMLVWGVREPDESGGDGYRNRIGSNTELGLVLGGNNDIDALAPFIIGHNNNADIANGANHPIIIGTVNEAEEAYSVAIGSELKVYARKAAAVAGSLNRIGTKGGGEAARDSAIVGGQLNTIDGKWAAIVGGRRLSVTKDYGVASGTQAVARYFGANAHSSGAFAGENAAPDNQTFSVRLRRLIETTSVTQLTLNGSGEVLIMPTNSVWTGRALVSAWRMDNGGAGQTASFEVLFSVASDGSSATVKSSTVTTLHNDADWIVDTASSGLVFQLRARLPTGGSVRFGATVQIDEVRNLS